ncbi:MAG: neutral zinc metallopeptidase [Thermoguttaceae bacterium]|jgi:predicted metalloprotease
MRWQEGGESENVEDQRQLPVGMALGGAGTVIVVVIALLLGQNPRDLIQQVQRKAAPPGVRAPQQDSPEEARKVSFVKHVLFQTEQVWTDLFDRRLHRTYQKPKLVLFTGKVSSACGLANSAVGPFYCPADEKVYIDLEFYDELKNKFHAGGDFANAYVIAHEVGHHVQNLMGISIESKHRKLPRDSENQLSVRLELQADFLAGVWAHYADQKWHILEAGDVEKAITAAQAIGDDRLQKQTQGYVVPEKFTHGTSKQRVYWFSEGLNSGNLKEADKLFNVPYGAL